jgi:altronate hydrolase
MPNERLINIGAPDRPLPPPAPTRSGGPRAIRVHASDDVAVAIYALSPQQEIVIGGARVPVIEAVAPGHKIALRDIEPGEPVVKYGYPIGVATAPIARGAWVHSHNLRTRLEGTVEYRYSPRVTRHEPAPPATFDGFLRSNGRVGTRNEVWVLNTVGCVNHAAEQIAREAAARPTGSVDGVYTFTHPYGCGQLGDDLDNTRKVLAGLIRNPNAGGVLLLGLGCENNQMDSLLAEVGDFDRDRLRFFNSQDVGDEVEEGLRAVASLVSRMEADRRTPVPASKLVLGHKCGGSDGFSGISANAVVGRIADRLSSLGGSVLLTEVPEMFGAEQELMDRAVDEAVFGDVVKMIDDFKHYFISHGQPIYENPSPGNKAGGLTTLEEKSHGAIQKGGHAPVASVLRYGEQVRSAGLSLLESPGNDAVSSTAMVVSGATVLLFTTGRGTPLGFPAPTIKISSNTGIAEKKPHWIDFNAGTLLDGTASMESLEQDLFALVLDVASGRKHTNNEKHGIREIAIWKDGVTL